MHPIRKGYILVPTSEKGSVAGSSLGTEKTGITPYRLREEYLRSHPEAASSLPDQAQRRFLHFERRDTAAADALEDKNVKLAECYEKIDAVIRKLTAINPRPPIEMDAKTKLLKKLTETKNKLETIMRNFSGHRESILSGEDETFCTKIHSLWFRLTPVFNGLLNSPRLNELIISIANRETPADWTSLLFIQRNLDEILAFG